MNIGIDIISSMEIIDGIAKYTGGMNYVKALLKAITLSSHDNVEWILLMPKGFISDNEDSEIFEHRIFKKRFADSLITSDFSNLNTLFLPQVNGSLLARIPNIKRKNPNIKIYATLHDRQHNYYKYDWMDRYYYNGISRTGLTGFIKYYVKKLSFDIIYKTSIKCIDKVFTVSNYSMQRLMCKNIRNIKYYIQGNIMEYPRDKMTHCGDYILFVGGGRPEKNLLRTLFAFKMYKDKSEKSYKLVITGVSDKVKDNLIHALGADYYKIKDCVDFKPYLSYSGLTDLYLNCRYVVFTSKAEGYGLPVREALSYGKTVLASRTTSVPEVAGGALLYVDPFSIDSILNGFEMLESDEVLKKYEKYARDRIKLIDQIAMQDINILIDELTE